MTRIELSEENLTVHLDGFDRIAALRRRFDIPLDRLVNVDTGPRAASSGPLARLPLPLPFGTFRQQGGRGLLQAPDPERTLVLELLDPRFSKLVIEVENAGEAAAAIRAACLN